MEAFSAILDFVEQYPSAEQKAYICTEIWELASLNLLAAMAHELSEKKVCQRPFYIFRALPLM